MTTHRKEQIYVTRGDPSLSIVAKLWSYLLLFKTYLYFIKPGKNETLFIVLYPSVRFIWLSFSGAAVSVWKILPPSRAGKWNCGKCFISSHIVGGMHATVLPPSIKDSDAICLTTLFIFVLECFMFWILLCCSKAVDEEKISYLALSLEHCCEEEVEGEKDLLCYMLLHLTGFKFSLLDLQSFILK